MKIHYYFLAFAMSSMAWAEQEAAGTAPAQDAATSQSEMTEPAGSSEPAATESATQAASAPEEEQAGFSRGSVVRSVFTTGIEDREPVDKLGDAQNMQENIYYFTELRDMSGQTATHRWEHNGEVQAEVTFDVRGPRWRVWSSKTFTPALEGDWKVSVLNGAGEVISEDVVNYTPAPAETTAPAATTSEEPAPQEGGQFEPPVNEQLLR